MVSKVQTILCATDLGSRSDQVFRMTAGIAQECGARIVLLHAIEQVSEGVQNMLSSMLPGSEMDKLRHEAKETALVSLEEQWKTFADVSGFTGEEPELLVERGEPAPAILEVADGIENPEFFGSSHDSSPCGGRWEVSITFDLWPPA